MKKHLKYIDGNSDKFWQIETSSNSYTVTYGKNGASGISKTKEFSDDAECEKEAEKLINEKIKKGYSETGEVNINASKTKSAKQDDFEEVYQKYEELIHYVKRAELFDFLDTQLNGKKEKFKKALKKTFKYWLSYGQLESGKWGMRGSEFQKDMLHATAIALCDKKEVSSFSIVFSLINPQKDGLIEKAIFKYKPQWLTDVLWEEQQKDQWLTPSYHQLVHMEKSAIIRYEPELFAFSLAKFANTTHHFRDKEKLDCLPFLTDNKETTVRDLPLLFDYETDIANTRDYHLQDKPNEVYRAWHFYFLELIEKGFISRKEVLQKSFEIQNKNWNNAIKTFFKVLIERLQPTTNELIENQNTIFGMLQNQTPSVVNLGLEYCKKIFDLPDFDKKAFFEWVTPVLQRADIKSGIKTALQIFEKIIKSDKGSQDYINLAVAEIFVVPVLELQERATKFLLKYAKPENEELREKLQDYKTGMLGNVATELQDFIGTSDENEESLTEEHLYEYKPTLPKLLTNPVTLPQDWNEILFHYGKFISSEEVIDTEILWNIFISQRHLFPEDYLQQLQPYVKQISKGLYGSIYCSCYKCVTEFFIKSKSENPEGEFKYKRQTHYGSKVFEVTYDLIHKVEQKMTSRSTLPLLSFPTHEPFWVEPKVLLQRIIDYHKTGETVDHSDLSIAICRMPRENVEDALPLLEQLTPEYQDLMKYCLGVSDEIILEKENVLSKIQNLISDESQTEKTKIASLWAIASRTYHPENIFEEFKKTYLYNVPNVVEPFHPEISFKEKWNEYIVNYQTKEKARTPSWWEMQIKMPDFKKIPKNLFYSIGLFHQGERYYSDIITEAQFNCLQSFTPQNQEALALSMLYKYKVYEGNVAIKSYALSLLQTYSQLKNYQLLHFAAIFFNDKKDIRNVCSDVLYQLIQDQKIDISKFAEKLGFLVDNKYGIFNRLMDALQTIKDASTIHNDALFQLFDGILSALTLDELPSNFKKLLEAYYDLGLKLKRTPTENALNYLEKFSKSSQKKIISNILLMNK